METIIISLGGSIIVPDGINTGFLKEFKMLVDELTGIGKRVVIITGGGNTARKYQRAAKEVSSLNPKDLDWLGIHCTRLNAQLVKSVFKGYTMERIVKNPSRGITSEKKIIIAAGWKPGFSTDYDAVLLAKNLGAGTIINLSNIEHVYEEDPKKNPDARKIERIGWKDFRKIIGDRWDPGLNTPFDPVAAKEAEKLGMRVAIMDGNNLENMRDFIYGKEFTGTIIE